jgi:hypothetical protein
LLTKYHKYKPDKATNPPKITEPVIIKIIAGILEMKPLTISPKNRSAGRIKIAVKKSPEMIKHGNETKTVAITFFASNLLLLKKSMGIKIKQVKAVKPK